MRALKITHSITRRDEQSLEKYLTEISRYDVLTPEEELRLFKAYKNGSEAAFLKLILHNLRFVVSVAKQYQIPGLWLGDLINEGNIGLIKAARRFDETRGFKFISYAVWWIRQAILQAINEKSRKIRLPLNFTGNTTKIIKKIVEFLQKKEREPSVRELVELTDLSEDVIRNCLLHYKKCGSLDAPMRDDSETSLVNMISDSSIAKPDFDIAVRDSQKKEIKHLLSTLSKRQATIISMYFGIDRQFPMSLTDIAHLFGVSRERIRQVKDRGLRKLRIRAKSFHSTFAPA